MKTMTAILLSAAMATSLSAKARIETPTGTSTPFDCDAIVIDQHLDSATSRALKPAHSLDSIAAILTRHGVPFARSHQVLTLDGSETKLMRQINMLPPGEPLILSDRDSSLVCVLEPSADSI